MNPIAVTLDRAGTIESVHEVHAVVVGRDGRPTEVFGDAPLVSFWRSAMKPFQADAMVASGAFDDLGLGDAEVAIACASHHGTPVHVAAAGRILEALGLDEDALACGAHRPTDLEAAMQLDTAGRLPGRIHNNCSGKHAGMLALARTRGWPESGYHLRQHPVQETIRARLADWLSLDPDELAWGVDGCGVPTPALPLEVMARAYARLAASEAEAARRVVGAMTSNPIMVSGRLGLSAQVMTGTGGRLVAKEGAEGVFCLAESTGAWAAAFKVRDGAMRAIGPAVVGTLAELGLLDEGERERMADLAISAVENTRHEPVARLLMVPLGADHTADLDV